MYEPLQSTMPALKNLGKWPGDKPMADNTEERENWFLGQHSVSGNLSSGVYDGTFVSKYYGSGSQSESLPQPEGVPEIEVATYSRIVLAKYMQVFLITMPCAGTPPPPPHLYSNYRTPKLGSRVL